MTTLRRLRSKSVLDRLGSTIWCRLYSRDQRQYLRNMAFESKDKEASNLLWSRLGTRIWHHIPSSSLPIKYG